MFKSSFTFSQDNYGLNLNFHKFPSYILITLFSVFIYSNLHAQQVSETEPPCGYDLLYPDTIPLPAIPQNFTRTNNDSYIIPVVVHVIHENGLENISDAQILSGIQEMNAQFSGAEGGPDSEIKFRLATLDPDGNCTNGIVRIFNQPAGVHIENYPTDECTLKDIDKANLSHWPNSKYMNIWIVEKIKVSQGSDCTDTPILGYSVGGTTIRKGITIKYKHFGTIETANYSEQADVVNTNTHEAGHFFGLAHPWGASSSCTNACELSANGDCHTLGDLVCDTDPCNGVVTTMDCSNIPLDCTECEGFDFTDYVYPLDNYMSYNKPCQFRFTPGQIERMHGMLETDPILINLYSGSNLTATGTSDNIFNAQLELTATITSSTCPNQNDGAISISVANGTGSYTYLWNTGATSSSISDLAEGWYSVEVQDLSSVGCSVLKSFYVPGVYLNFEVTSTCVSASEGAIDITVYDSSGNILINNTYLWNNGATSEDITGLSSGEYSVTVTTATGCVLEQSFAIKFRQRPIINIENDIVVANVDCNNVAGTIFTEINSFGSSDTYQYYWTDSDGNLVGTTQNLVDVAPGIYTLVVTNPFSGCSSYPAEIEVQTEFTWTNPTEYTVSGSVTITGNFSYYQGINVLNGASLTIENSILTFSEMGGITVKPGGTLYINNSYLTDTGCDTHWKGIFVYGDPDKSQHGSEAQYQGQGFINNSTIENAKRGITNYGTSYYTNGGGMFRCYETQFKNCEISGEIRPYTDCPTYLPVVASFYNCDFIWDSTYQFMNSPYHPMILINGVNEVRISGCHFENTNQAVFVNPNNSPYRAAAIYAIDGSLKLTRGCNGLPPYAMTPYGCADGDVPSKIEGFNYGVVMGLATGSTISKTTFKCYRGLWCGASKAVQLTQNTFTDLPTELLGLGSSTGSIPGWDVSYGAYFNYSTLFVIKGNDFYYPNTTVENVGLFVRASGSLYHQLYNNDFTNTEYGIIAYDDNRGFDQNSGLKLECNTFNNQEFPITASATIMGNVPTGWGISHFQGMPSIDLQNPGFPTGNYFTGSQEEDVYNELESVIYCTYPNENLTSWFGIIRELLTIPNGCPSSFPSPYEKAAQIVGHKASADSISAVLSALIDDGNTEALTQEVVLTNYGEAVELYYDLMQVSPNLSEEVMIEAINKEFELPTALLALILESNPHAAKSGKIQKELDERMIPLSEYERAMIDQGLELVSYKEGLEAKRSFHESRYIALLNELIIEILSDTTIIDKVGAIESLIDGYERVDHYYLLTDLYLKCKDVLSAQTQLNAIAGKFGLDPRRDAEYADYLEVYGIIFNKINTGGTTLTQAEYNQLMIIAYRHSTLAAGLALATLHQYAGYDYYEILVKPGMNPKSNSAKRNKFTAKKINTCKIYPNPTAGILMIEIPTEYENTIARITNSSGKIVFEKSGLTHRTTLNLRDFASGNYNLLLLTSEGKRIESQQIQIMR